MTEKYIKPIDYHKTINKGHGRLEKREVRVYPEIQYITKDTKSKWNSNLSAMYQVNRKRSIRGKESWEKSYYVGSIELEAVLALDTLRNHWSVENQNHYVRDVVLEEDKSRIRMNPGIMARLRSFTLNILRVNSVKNITQELFFNSNSFDNLLFYDFLM